MLPPAIHTPRLHLRQPVDHDVFALLAIYGDPRTFAHSPYAPFSDLDRARDVLEIWQGHWLTHGFGTWTVSLREQPELPIGFGGISHRFYGDHPRINVGFRFTPDVWGQGLATELAQASLEVALHWLGLPEVHGIVRPSNLASQRVLTRAGMVDVGELDDVPGHAPSRLFLITQAQWQEQQQQQQQR